MSGEICGDHDDSWDVTGIVCEMPAGHSGSEHGAYVWQSWWRDEPSADNPYSVKLTEGTGS